VPGRVIVPVQGKHHGIDAINAYLDIAALGDLNESPRNERNQWGLELLNLLEENARFARGIHIELLEF